MSLKSEIHADIEPDVFNIPSSKVLFNKNNKKNINPIEKIGKIIYLDGIRVCLLPKDIDGDGRIGSTEYVQQRDSDEQDIMQQSELKEVIAELNEDKLSKEGMSPIDMKTNLSAMEKTAYHAFDALITMKFLPKSASSLSRIGKRLNVSISGQGRKDIVDIVGRNQEQKKSVLDKMGLSMGKPPQ